MSIPVPNTESNHKHYTRGGQISFHNLRMWFQINKTIINLYLIFWLMISVLFSYLMAPYGLLTQTLSYHYATLLHAVGMNHSFDIPYLGGHIAQTVPELLGNHYYAKAADRYFLILVEAGGLSLLVSLVMALCLTRYFVKKGRLQTENQFVRGASLASVTALKKQIIRQKKASDLHLDGLPLIAGSEVQHLLVHGTVGMGKSQFIMKLMDSLRARGDRVIVYDKGCAFTSAYFQDGRDALLNPFDARCANWDLWAEAPRDELMENMAESLIPMEGENQPFWVNAARTVFASVACKMREDPNRSMEKLLSLLVTGEFTELEPYLAGTAAATLVSNKIEKTAISIRSVITTYLKGSVIIPVVMLLRLIQRISICQPIHRYAL